MNPLFGYTPSPGRAKEVAQWWWAWLVIGIVWIIAALVVLRFTGASVVTAGVIIGVLFCVSGIQSFALSRIDSDWAGLAMVFGFVLLIGGVLALFNPILTFLAVADLLGFVFVIIGVYWIIDALATRERNPMWSFGLGAGIIMIGLGFATFAKLVSTKADMLLVLVGIWALLHGITDIVRAFRIKHVGEVADTTPRTDFPPARPVA